MLYAGERDMTNGIRTRTRAVALVTLMLAGYANTVMAVDPGIGVGAAGVGVAPGVGVGAPGVGARDPGINQPGVAGNVGAPGVGAPGVGAVDPGLNQPGVAGNVGGVARRSVRR
jgi:hypothetical protein